MAIKARLACEIDFNIQRQTAFNSLSRVIGKHPSAVIDTLDCMLAGEEIPDELRKHERLIGKVTLLSENGQKIGFDPTEPVWAYIFDDPLHTAWHARVTALKRSPESPLEIIRTDSEIIQVSLTDAQKCLAYTAIRGYACGVKEGMYEVPIIGAALPSQES